MNIYDIKETIKEAIVDVLDSTSGETHVIVLNPEKLRSALLELCDEISKDRGEF